MKKLILILLALPLLFSCGNGGKIDNDLTNQKMRGHVKEIAETSFDAKESFGEVKKDGVKDKKEQKFNKQGNITEENIYDENGELTSKWKYKYDKDGNMTESNKYDENGDLTSKWKYKYDKDGNITESNTYDENGDLTYKYTYKYDKDGNRTESNNYDKDGDLTYKWKYKYDKDGNMTESNKYDENGDLTYKFQYKYQYDKKKNWTVKTTAYLTDIDLTDNTDEDYKIMTITEREITYY